MSDESNQNIIALLTDFGTKDYFAGALKGVILSINRGAQIVDITHEIEPQNIKSASFTLRACYRNFPRKTIFVAVVDPGVGSERRAVLVDTGEYFFIAPDNGLLSFVFDEAPEFRVIALTNEKFFAANISSTFHGRDVFAPVAAHLSKGVKPNEFGAGIEDFVRFEETAPRKISETEIEAEIIEIDRFGNLITNLKREDLPGKFALEIGERRIEKLQNYFAEAETGEIFMISGSAGFLEIAAFHDSAKNILRAEIGQKITVKTR
jgi:S-adenosylmethionine hydrolase